MLVQQSLNLLQVYLFGVLFMSETSYAEQKIDALLSDSLEQYQAYSNEEIQALSLAVISHRRMIKTLNFNSLVREFDKRQAERTDNYSVEQLYSDFSTELELRRFNFQESSVSIEFSPTAVERLLELSRTERLSHPRVKQEISSLARKIEAQTRRECYNLSVSRDDIEQELTLYLVESAEVNFDPAKASYITYAITTLRFRGKILLASARLRNSREVLTCFENDEETNSYHEKLQVDSGAGGTNFASGGVGADIVLASKASLSSHQYEVSTALNSFFQSYTPLEKTLLYLKNQLHCNINTFGFDVNSLIESASDRAKVSLIPE